MKLIEITQQDFSNLKGIEEVSTLETLQGTTYYKEVPGNV